MINVINTYSESINNSPNISLFLITSNHRSGSYAVRLKNKYWLKGWRVSTTIKQDVSVESDVIYINRDSKTHPELCFTEGSTIALFPSMDKAYSFINCIDYSDKTLSVKLDGDPIGHVNISDLEVYRITNSKLILFLSNVLEKYKWLKCVKEI